MSKDECIFDGNYFEHKYMMQLPYYSHDTTPICVDLEPMDAYKMFKHGICKYLKVDEGLYLMVPKIPAVQNMVFQRGEAPV